MKKICTILLTLALAASHLAAQNWSPLTVGETHHFRLLDSTHITHTLRIDSAQALPNGSTVYSLNRVLRRWTEEDSAYAWVNQGQFLGQTATRMADGSWVFEGLNKLTNVLNLTIVPTASVGQSWVSNPSTGQTATVTAVALGSVLGQPDSVKTIQFSDGATWLLSKSHGLMRCPDPQSGGLEVQLSGLETKQLGDRLYRFEDFFDYEAGDVFEIESSRYNFLGEQNEYSKNVVIQKTVLPDGLRYTMSRIGKLSSHGFGGDKNWTVKDTVQWWRIQFDHPNVGAYPHQTVTVGWGENWTSATLLNDGLQVGSFSPKPSDSNCGLYHSLQPDEPWFGTPNLLMCSWPEYFAEYRKGPGLVSERVNIIDNINSFTLLGAVMSGDTVWGKISPDWLFTSTQMPGEADRVLRIAPNPAQDEAFVQLPETLENEQVAVQVFSLEGRLLRQWEASPESGSLRLDLSGISPQTCLVAVRTKAGVWHGRVVKGR